MSGSSVLDALRALPAERGLIAREGSAWLRCPVHGGGGEKTPSLKITLEGPYAGSCYCFACRVSGGWHRTVELLGLPREARFLSAESVADPFSDADADAMLGRRRAPGGRDASYRERWPRSQSWRGVPGSLLVDVGASMILSEREPLLRLPAMVRGRERGYIDCVIEPEPGQRLKYINSRSTSGWSRDALFPYDHVRSLSPAVLAIVEGPRDALVTIACGLPALATLGASSWSPACARLVEALAPDTLLIMADPDEAGEGLSRLVYDDLHAKMRTRVVLLPSKFVRNDVGLRVRRKLMDPADFTPQSLARLMARLEVRL